MNRPADSENQSSNQTVSGSSLRGGSGSGPTIGIAGAYHQETYYDQKIVVNNTYSQVELTKFCELLETDEPQYAYPKFRQLEDPRARRFVLRTLPLKLAAQYLTFMAEADDGLRDCVEHIGPMASCHALRLLQVIDPKIRASILALMKLSDSSRLLDDLSKGTTEAGEPVRAAFYLSEMAAVRIDVVKDLLTNESLAQWIPVWLNEMAMSNPAVVAECLTQIHPMVACGLLVRMEHDPDLRPDVLNQLSPWFAIALLAGMNPEAPQLVQQLLRANPEWNVMIGTWPSYIASRVALQTSVTIASAEDWGSPWRGLRATTKAVLGTWWRTRQGAAQWTSDLRPRRLRDAKYAIGGMLVAAVLTALIMVVVWPNSSAPVKNSVAGSTSAGETARPPTGAPLFPADLPLLANQAYWSDQECPAWSEQTQIKKEPTERVTLLLVCSLKKNDPAVEVVYLQYPPGTIPFHNRPTIRDSIPEGEPGVTVPRILVPEGRSAEESRVWSHTDGLRHGTYIEYLPDPHMSGIWLEEAGNPASAMILFGPDPAGKSDAEVATLFESLQTVLKNHGYKLSP